MAVHRPVARSDQAAFPRWPGRDDQGTALGVIAPGKAADIIGVAIDPTFSVATLEKVTVGMKGGTAFLVGEGGSK